MSMADGIALYEQRQYDRALEAFEEAGGDSPSAVLLLNEGAAHWRLGDVARAIACWRAASDLSPRDADISHNLAFARAAIDDLPDPVPPPASWMAFATPGEVGALGFALLAAGSAGALWRRRRLAAGDDPAETPWLWASPWVGTWAAGAVVAGVAISGGYAAAARPVGVVAVGDVGLRPEPLAEAAAEQPVAAGAEVAMLDESGGFVLVETGDGDVGWVAAEVIAGR